MIPICRPWAATGYQLQQVVMNLLLNAFDAIGESSSENRTVLVETSQHDAEIQVTVRDSGAGITPGYARTPGPAVQQTWQ